MGNTKGSNSEVRAFLQRNGQVIIRMRGLPFDATAKDVMEFFIRGDQPTNIVDGEDGVLFVHYPDKRSTGDAFVMVKTEQEAIQALLKHKETMGTRYIELFRSVPAEIQQIFRRSQDPKNFQTSLKDIPFVPLSILPPEMLTYGNIKDCIRLRNLPVECGIEQVLEFLGLYSQHIGQPFGEAFVQMDSEKSSFNAAIHKNNKYMFFNGKKRYIEVLQCSNEEMNQILLGLAPSNLIPTNIQPQTISSTHRIGPILSLSPLPLPMSISLPIQPSSSTMSVPPVVHVPSTALSPLIPATNMNGFLPNTTYYRMQVFYYPTLPISQSNCLQTGQISTVPTTFVLREDTDQY